MDDTAVTRQRYKKGNKENAEPANGVQSFIKNEPTAQFHQKNIQKRPSVASKQPDGKDTSVRSLKDAKNVERERHLTAKNGQKHSQASPTKQGEKGKKVVREFSKPPLSVVASKPTPGLYKGKIVESKIACIWKPSRTVERPQAKSLLLKPKSPESRKLEKRMEPKSVFEPLSTIHNRNRLTMETAEERRAKVAGWRASKGKTLKRPAMKTVETKVFEVQQTDLKSQSEPDPQHEAEDFLKAQEKVLPDDHYYGARSQQVDLTPPNQYPVEPQENMDDLIVNLSALMEAMATSPRSEDESALITNVSSNAELDDNTPEDECREGLKNKLKVEVGDKLSMAQVKTGKESKDQKVVKDEMMESKNEHVMEHMPQREDTSVVKYSVTTTPYLQSVKKTIDDASRSASKRKGSIKDLKFLTPVRRSCRIQRKSSHLPSMLQDHDPCVTSLAELGRLDSPNAFIYRKNPALTEYLSDLPELRSVHENCS